MSTTLRDVASLAGVSFKTVSNVLNGYPYISSGTRAKVLDAIERLDYTPNHAARSLRAGRTDTISLAVPQVRQPYFAELAAELAASAETAGRRVLVEQTNASRERELEILAGASRHLTDGLVFSPLTIRSEDLSSLRGSLPLVLLGESLFPQAVDHITMQNVAASRAATAHLLLQGRRRIAVIGSLPPGSPGYGTSRLRVQGYREALEAADVPFDEKLLVSAGHFDRSDGVRGARELADRGISYDAVYGITDGLALGALHEINRQGRGVPDDVAVIGFDDLDDGLYSEPALTTVDAGRRDIARLAVDLLLQRIKHPSREVQFLEVDFKVVTRGSA